MNYTVNKAKLQQVAQEFPFSQFYYYFSVQIAQPFFVETQ